MRDDDRLYHLLVVAAHAARRHTDTRLRELAGVTAAQAAALFALAEQPGRSQRDLAATLSVNEPAVAEMVARLVAAGLVVRSRSSSDGRTMELRLSQAGQEALGRVRPAVAELNADLFGAASDEDLAAFRRVLASITARVTPNP
ncbi:MAG: MarR family winged helix-turn-helix transcriptional regulator [Actinomycetota bacterium]|nr:MarR family winged helix-turn-helix transcriptional regulator [Actinomycetota bacterium]